MANGIGPSRGFAGRHGAALVSKLKNLLQLSLFDPPASAESKAAIVKAGPSAPLKKSSVFATGTHPAFAALCRGPYSHIEVTVKKRLWDSWRVTWTRRNEALRMEVPASLIEAPE